MKAGTLALAFAAALSIGFVLYDLSGLSHQLVAAPLQKAPAGGLDDHAEQRRAAEDSVNQQVADILAQRARAAASAAPVNPTSPPVVVAPRTDTPAEFAEVRDIQYTEMIRHRTEHPELNGNGGPSVEDLLRMKESGLINQ